MSTLNEYIKTRYIPKKFEPAEIKKLRLQEEMSGLKHHFSIENAANVQATTSQQLDEEDDIDPVDECKLVKRDICHMRMN